MGGLARLVNVRVAVFCNVLQCAALCCSVVLWCIASEWARATGMY